jgi:hypothetical protein
MALNQKNCLANVSKIKFYFQIHLSQNSRCKIKLSEESHRALMNQKDNTHQATNTKLYTRFILE